MEPNMNVSHSLNSSLAQLNIRRDDPNNSDDDVLNEFVTPNRPLILHECLQQHHNNSNHSVLTKTNIKPTSIDTYFKPQSAKPRSSTINTKRFKTKTKKSNKPQSTKPPFIHHQDQEIQNQDKA
eukprot:1085749_1